jgi:hypothetical protein
MRLEEIAAEISLWLSLCLIGGLDFSLPFG